MTDRQKFWLKALLAVTFPIWVLPSFLGLFLAMFGSVCWHAAESIVEPNKWRGTESRGP